MTDGPPRDCPIATAISARSPLAAIEQVSNWRGAGIASESGQTNAQPRRRLPLDASILMPTKRQPLARTPISPERFAHFAVRTSNADAMRRWYKIVLNAHVVFDDGLLCLLTYDDEHQRLALVRDRDEPKLARDNEGLAHLAFGYRSLRDLLSTYARLKIAGIAPFRQMDHGASIAFYYHDPDGRTIALLTDGFSAKEENLCYIASEDFRKNPFGAPFDPDALVREYERPRGCRLS
jgi:catechol 2,3-dioxygenase-like lactoylglutathione lyase family enzyme